MGNMGSGSQKPLRNFLATGLADKLSLNNLLALVAGKDKSNTHWEKYILTKFLKKLFYVKQRYQQLVLEYLNAELSEMTELLQFMHVTALLRASAETFVGILRNQIPKEHMIFKFLNFYGIYSFYMLLYYIRILPDKDQ